MNRDDLVRKAAEAITQREHPNPWVVAEAVIDAIELAIREDALTSHRCDEQAAERAYRRAVDLEQELERVKHGAETLGKIIDRQVNDLLHWAGMDDQIGLDDPDQQTAWELVAGMPNRIKELEQEVRDARADERQKIAETLGLAWDDGNAVGLDGWIGPTRGEEPDLEGISARDRVVRKYSRLAEEAGR